MRRLQRETVNHQHDIDACIQRRKENVENYKDIHTSVKKARYWREFNTPWSIKVAFMIMIVDPTVNKINNIFIFILNNISIITIIVDGKMINHDVVINLPQFHKKKYY